MGATASLEEGITQEFGVCWSCFVPLMAVCMIQACFVAGGSPNSPVGSEKDNLSAGGRLSSELQLSKSNLREVRGDTWHFWSVFGAEPGFPHMHQGRIDFKKEGKKENRLVRGCSVRAGCCGAFLKELVLWKKGLPRRAAEGTGLWQ